MTFAREVLPAERQAASGLPYLCGKWLSTHSFEYGVAATPSSGRLLYFGRSFCVIVRKSIFRLCGNSTPLITLTATQKAAVLTDGVVEADAIPGWLNTPNEAFDGLKPLEIIERGEIDRLWNMIIYLESGVAG